MELHGGLIVADDAITLALRLEGAGHVLTSKDGVLVVSNGSALSPDDRAAVQQLKRHLLAIAGYDADAAAVGAPPLATGVWSASSTIGNSADTADEAKETAASQVLEAPAAPAPKARKRAKPTPASEGLGLFDG